VRDDLPADLAEAVALGGEMGSRFARYDWAAHPLGAPAGWSPQLRATVAVALTSRFPIVLWLDPDQLYLVYNDAYLAILGDKHPAALGRPGRQVWWDIWDSIGGMLNGVVRTGRATWSDDLLLQLVTEGRPWERYFTFSYSPIFTGDGRVDGVFCAVAETTERVVGERRLNLLNAVGTTLMESRTVEDTPRAFVHACGEPMPDLPFVALYAPDRPDRPSRLRAATPTVAHLLPDTLDALIGAAEPLGGWQVVGDIPDHLPQLASTLEQCPEQALAVPVGGTQNDTFAGTLVIGLNARRPLDEQYLGFCRLLSDQLSAALTTADSYERERRRADALAELDRAKTAFLTNVSHEFRTPLTLLLGPVDDAIADAGGDIAQLERLQTVRRNAGRLLRLVNSLLEFSRAEAGRARAELVRVDLGELTREIASCFTELCHKAGLDLRLRCAPAVAEVDVRMWETIVLNLLSNAVKFTLAGSITISVVQAGPDVQVRVSDTGVGVDADDLPHLFDRFFRGRNTRGRSVEGTGIGLSLVRNLVELQHGDIRADSTAGGGTTITITLPASPGTVSTTVEPVGVDNPYVVEAAQWLEEADDSGVTSHPAAQAARRNLVLIVDDNADMRRHLRRLLAPHWETIAYADGKSALRGVREHRPSLVITDVMMPELDGFGFVDALRADPELAGTPVLMLSARAGIEAAGEGFAHGADDYLPKPFRSDDLINRVAARLSAASREREVRERSEADSREATESAEFKAALGAANSVRDVLAALLAYPTASLHATGLGLGLAEEGRIRITYAGAVSTELRDRYHVVELDAPVPLAEVIRTGQPMVIADTAEAAPRFHWSLQDSEGSIRALAIHPLIDALGEVIGALALYWPHSRAFPAADLERIRATVQATVTRLDRVRAIEREHRIATGFQQQLLDLDLSSTAAVVSAVYEPAAEAMSVGGDWYLAMPLAVPGQLAVSVGDVVGHGLPAATVMSTLRASTNAAAISDADPGAVLAVLEQCAASRPGAVYATVAYAALDSTTRTLRYACAGHPYPLVVFPDGTTEYLTAGRRSPLAASVVNLSSPPGSVELPPGSLVLLYTDGLVERRGESLDVGFDRLAAAAGDCAMLPAGAACDELLRRMRPAGGYTDDVALLAIRLVGVVEDRFVACLPARAEQVPAARHQLRDWLKSRGVDESTCFNILLSTCEVLTNAIEHGSPSAPRTTVALEAFAREDRITVTVTDTGRWTADSSASRRVAIRGRGLTLINGLCDHVETRRTRRGTRVTLTYRRVRPPERTEGF
jgi:signal transduction histidine kinase/DNA-binding response OmpR family regulator/serine phosphatase RsbU (regulator of sigma subunit)